MEQEESFSWDFSKLCANLLQVNYFVDREVIDKKFLQARKVVKDDPSSILLDEIILKERRRFGLSAAGGDTFYWRDGFPIINQEL